jgi:hypothetical protein
MRYILLIYDDEKGWANLSEAERQHSIGEFEELRQEIAGQYVAGSQLHPTSATTSVRTRNGKRMVTDGPFAETREQIGGYWLIDAKDLDAAIDIAARIPSGPTGVLEIRPLVEAPALTPGRAATGECSGRRRSVQKRRNHVNHLETGNEPKDCHDERIGDRRAGYRAVWVVPISSTGPQNPVSEHGPD